MRPTIIIPTFNRKHLVRRAIDTALSQTLPCEVILVDHGSTDGTPQLASSYGDRIRYLRRETDAGPAACWRDGLEAATGEFVHFTFDDDWIEPSFMHACVAQFSARTAFVYSRARLISPDGQELGAILRHPGGRQPIERIVQHLLLTTLTISPGCAVFRRSDALECLLTEVPGANGVYGKATGVGEDLLLFLLASLNYPEYVHLPEPLACFLAHPGSITVDAQTSGRAELLAKSYDNARMHYLTRDLAHRPLNGIDALLFKLKWRLGSSFSYRIR